MLSHSHWGLGQFFVGGGGGVHWNSGEGVSEKKIHRNALKVLGWFLEVHLFTYHSNFDFYFLHCQSSSVPSETKSLFISKRHVNLCGELFSRRLLHQILKLFKQILQHCWIYQNTQKGCWTKHWPYMDYPHGLMEGDMGVYGIVVLGFFSCSISVILILTCGIAVSSSSAVCGFSSFWLTVFGEIRYCSQYYGTVYVRFPFDTVRKTKHGRTYRSIKVNI